MKEQEKLQQLSQKLESIKSKMPDFMKKLQEELDAREVPDPELLSKEDYIRAWMIWFDPDKEHEYEIKSNLQRDIEVFGIYSKKVLTEGFLWVRSNFAELDLLSNTWYSTTRHVMKKIKNRYWDSLVQCRFKLKIIMEQTEKYGWRW